VRRGERTIVAEVSGRGELAQLYGRAEDAGSERAGGEVEVAPQLWSIQIDTARALAEYLREHLPLRMLADLVGATRLIGYLAAATPGLRELLNAGKVWELAQPQRRIPNAAPFDLVIVDAPASGHALALLCAPQAFARAAQGGPIAHQGGRIDEMLHDRTQTALVAVARAEDGAVSELLELCEALASQLGLTPDLIAVNAVPRKRFEPGDVETLRSTLTRTGTLTAAARPALERALAEARGCSAAREQIERLAQALPGVPLVELEDSETARFGLTEVESLSRQLEVAL
jgi:anion-transporting  ArsA/GET3 family ATPase